MIPDHPAHLNSRSPETGNETSCPAVSLPILVDQPSPRNGFSDLTPKYATPGSACFDIKAALDRPMPLYSGEPMEFGTGLRCIVPVGHVLLVFGRSGLAFKHGVRLANGVAVIDSDYRGEIRLKLVRDYGPSGVGLVISPGDRIAQGMILPIPAVFFNVLADESELEPTARGDGGLGSTGLR